MAKKANTSRVFQLAKSLGVTSKDIIAKCQAEGIEGITNHMSAISLGLSATVCEWFGEGQSSTVTAVETATPVDVARVRSKAKKKTTKKAAVESTLVEDKKDLNATATKAKTKTKAETKEPVEVLAPPAPAVDDTQIVVPPGLAKDSPTITELPDGGVVDQPAHEKTDPALAPAAKVAAKDPRSPQMNVPDRPATISPAGPMLAEPSETTLAGPKVIRVETPDIILKRVPSQNKPDSTIKRGGPRAGRGAGTMYPDKQAPESAPGEQQRTSRGGTSKRNKRRSPGSREEGTRVARAYSTDHNQKSDWTKQDLLERDRRLTRAGGFFKAHRRDNLKRAAGGGHKAQTAAQAGGKLTVQEPLSIKGLSSESGIKVADMVKKLFLAGKDLTINSMIDTESACELMLEFGIELEVIEQKTAEQKIVETFKKREVTDERPRNPIITILGHVDHGKTSLLDRIRNTNVAEGEAGGITQATSAFQVPVKAGDKQRLITFIDTPGHEAFTEMRARGANVTDIVVLVVAADDGVMPQTLESINHAKAAKVPIVIALNKIDKAEATDANLQRIYGQLAEHDLAPPDWGGSTEIIKTSALKNQGIQDLLDVLDYQSELLDLKGDFGGYAEGSVLESKIEDGRGPVANVLVQQGKLKRGDFVVAGKAFGKVRDIVNDHGKRIEEADPSTPVTISGINQVPDPGDQFYVVKSLKEAEDAAQERRDADRERSLFREKVTLDNIFEKMSSQDAKELPLILKGDVQGSVDTLKATLVKISTDDITIAIKHTAVGGINDSDILLAQATGAILIGYNVTASSKARKHADSKNIDIRLYDVIYDIIDDVTKAAEGLLDPEHKLEVLGHAEVRDVFKISKVGTIAGCYVTDGVIERNALIRITRADIVIENDRKLDQLKRFKDDAKEVRSGQECGMKIEAYDDIKVGDVLECYKRLEVKRTLAASAAASASSQ